MRAVDLEGRLPDLQSTRRRRVALLAVLLLVLLGAGLGTLAGGDGPDEPETPVITLTPESPTPTATPADDTATETPPTTAPGTDDETPTDTPEPAEEPPTETPTETPTPTPTPTATPIAGGDSGGSGGSAGGGGGGGGGSGGATPTPSVTLQTAGSGVIVDYAGAVPGESGRESIVLRNAGDAEARLLATDVNVTDFENGLVGDEGAVDGTPDDGELSAHVLVVLEVHYPNGTVGYFYDTGAGARSLAELGGIADEDEGGWLGPGEEAEVVFDWHVPGSTGNEIQSDGAEFDVEFGLRTS